MNDDKLTSLFQDAASAAPEPGFDYLDVTRASQRITRRRRVALSSVAAVVVAVAGTGVVVSTMRDQGTLTSAASAPAAAPENSPLMGRADGAGAASAPLGVSGAECVDKNDPELRAIVDQALPEIAAAPNAAVSLECAPGGGRQVNVQVTDGGVSGLLNVTYEPQGATPRPIEGALSAPTASGGTVTVSSEAVGPRGPSGGPAPYADRLQSVVAYLAPRL